VTAGQETDEQPVDHVFLPDDAPRGLPRHLVNEPGVSRRLGLRGR
jgi:hypothetical protein